MSSTHYPTPADRLDMEVGELADNNTPAPAWLADAKAQPLRFSIPSTRPRMAGRRQRHADALHHLLTAITAQEGAQ